MEYNYFFEVRNNPLKPLYRTWVLEICVCLECYNKINVEFWIVPEGLIGSQLQEHLQHSELFLCVA